MSYESLPSRSSDAGPLSATDAEPQGEYQDGEMPEDEYEEMA